METISKRVKFKKNDGNLLVGERSLKDVLAIVGQLPCYVYDREIIANRIAELREKLPSCLNLHYAMKANPSSSVVHYIAGKVDGIDVASHKELKLALETGVPPKEISMAGPGKSESDLRAAVAAGITINVESTTELRSIYRIKKLLEVSKLNLAIRVNPDFKVKSVGMAMTGSSTQFGTDVEKIPEILQLIENKNDIVGLHIFSGSQNLDSEALSITIRKTFECAKNIINEKDISIRRLNIGGGIGIPYFEGDSEVDLSVIGRTIEEETRNWHQVFPSTIIEMELGRYIVGEAGVYLCEVIDKKESRGKTFLVTNGGLHHHLSATGNFGQVFRRNYPMALANKLGDESTEEYGIVGPLCTPIDTLGSYVKLPKAEIGDIVAIFQSGAYGYSASPHLFLGHPSPVEILL